MRHSPDKRFKPCDFEDAEHLDHEYGMGLLRDTHALEMKQLIEYKTSNL
jgi:hypothetical protein